MSTDGQGTKWRRKIAENFNRLTRAHERYRQTTDRQTTDGRTTAYSEREFTFAKNLQKFLVNVNAQVRYMLSPVHLSSVCLWSPYVNVIGQTIIFLPCGFFFLLFSSPNLSGCRMDVYHTSSHGVALV